MIDVDRLNNTIAELEVQSENMKTASEYYKQLIGVSEEIAATSSSQKDINESVEGIIKDLINLKVGNEELMAKFANSNEKIIKDVKKLEDEILKNVQALSSENNKLYSDFQQFLNSKLELFKSDMQLEIRGVVSRLGSSMENDFKKAEEQAKSDSRENKMALDKMQTGLTDFFEIQSKRNKINILVMLGIFIVSVACLIINLR